MFNNALVFAIAVTSVLAYAAEPTGTWSGKITVDTSKLTADKKAQVEATTGKLKITLVLKKDHTFNSSVAGSQDSKPHTTSGTWNFKGNTVNMIASKTDGKATAASTPRSMVLSKDGKTMVMTIASPPAKGGQAPPKVQVVFKKVA